MWHGWAEVEWHHFSHLAKMLSAGIFQGTACPVQWNDFGTGTAHKSMKQKKGIIVWPHLPNISVRSSRPCFGTSRVVSWNASFRLRTSESIPNIHTYTRQRNTWLSFARDGTDQTLSSLTFVLSSLVSKLWALSLIFNTLTATATACVKVTDALINVKSRHTQARTTCLRDKQCL